MSTGEEERDQRRFRYRSSPRGVGRAKSRQGQAKARHRRPDRGRRALQEAPQGHRPPRRDRASVRGVAGRLPAGGRRCPGFRPGRAPRQLVVKRFRKQVADQVKSTLLMASLEQIDEDYKLNPITQPKLDVEAIALPDDGPMSFEMDVEVRPEFAARRVQGPEGQAAGQDRFATRTSTPSSSGSSSGTPRSSPSSRGPPRIGDYLTADLTFLKPDGSVLNEVKEIQFRLQPELRFQDGQIPEIGEALEGVKPGETREVEAKLGTSVADPDLRGKTGQGQGRGPRPEAGPAARGQSRVPEVDRLRQPRRAARGRPRGARSGGSSRSSSRPIRRQILDALIAATPFDLPADLVSRQEKSTICRLVMELRQEGFTDNEIRAREAEIRANAHEMTLRSLKEFFILAKIAEAEGIKVEDEDLELEIEAMAARTDESVRRVRARVEKEGLADALATQILERKALDHILESVEIEDVQLDETETAVETVDQTASPAAESDAGATGQ